LKLRIKCMWFKNMYNCSTPTNSSGQHWLAEGNQKKKKNSMKLRLGANLLLIWVWDHWAPLKPNILFFPFILGNLMPFMSKEGGRFWCCVFLTLQITVLCSKSTSECSMTSDYVYKPPPPSHLRNSHWKPVMTQLSFNYN